MVVPRQLTLEEFIKTSTPFYNDPAFEAEFDAFLEDKLKRLKAYEHAADPVENLVRFLRAEEDFLNIVLSLMNLSQEKFMRILSQIRILEGTFVTEWKMSQIKRRIVRDDVFAQRIAHLLLKGNADLNLAQHVPKYHLDQLSLPEQWEAILSDERVLKNQLKQKYFGEYNVKKGLLIERLIRQRLEQIQARYGVTFAKGHVVEVQKEIDCAIPSVDDPYVLILSSYMETTSSDQTQRADSQAEIYHRIDRLNIRYKTRRAFVNFVDGAGWWARQSDLRKLVDGCHYILNIKNLDMLEGVIVKHVPGSSPKPPNPNWRRNNHVHHSNRSRCNQRQRLRLRPRSRARHVRLHRRGANGEGAVEYR